MNLSGDPSMADILKQIRGAKVSVTVADETVTGAILGVEPRQKLAWPCAGQRKSLSSTWLPSTSSPTAALNR